MNAKAAAWFQMMTASVACFHLGAFSLATPMAFIAAYFFLLRASETAGSRGAFYTGFVIGYAWFSPHLGFFWTLFGFAAVLLWAILALFIGLFAATAQRLMTEQRAAWRWAIPVVWTGFEHFRSELYYLKFSWLSPAQFIAPQETSPYLLTFGWYGYGLILMLLAVGALRVSWRVRTLGAALSLAIVMALPTDIYSGRMGRPLKVAGMQVEFPDPDALPGLLNHFAERAPDADLLILGEYTLTGPLPQSVQEWCRAHSRYLIIGGEDYDSDGRRYNTAFVIGPDGSIVHRQAKSAPIQFFDDGLPAPTREVWNSPWGKLGLLVCYDLSYRQFGDDLVRQGAQALIVPMLDVQEWGERQHILHSRIGPVRAAEYRVPVVRIAGSGISQIIDRSGRVLDSGSFPGQGEVLQATVRLNGPGRVPIDATIAPLCAVAAGVLFLWSLLSKKSREQSRCAASNQETAPMEIVKT